MDLITSEQGPLSTDREDPTTRQAGLGSANADVSEALLPRLYTDPKVAEAEQRLIFERTWQLAGHVSSLPQPGSYVTTQAGNQPVLVVRDERGDLRAYRNVCRHRASQLLTGTGQCKGAIRCRYHGWTYRFDGTLIGVPEGLAFGDRLDKTALGLLPVAIEEMCGLVFVNLDRDAVPLAELLGDLPARLARYRLPSLQCHARWDAIEPANWKIVAENYIEGYHIPIAHPGLMRMLDYKHYETEVHDHYIWFEAPFRSKPSSNRVERLYSKLVEPMPGLTEADRRVWRYVFIYPNTAIDLYPDQAATWQMLPHALDRTRDLQVAFRTPAVSLRTRGVHWLNLKVNKLVTNEDIDLVDAVQHGIQTRDYRCGPLSTRELAVAWFADRVRADLGEAAA
jgi:Rieske 2Fe-2S family protein